MFIWAPNTVVPFMSELGNSAPGWSWILLQIYLNLSNGGNNNVDASDDVSGKVLWSVIARQCWEACLHILTGQSRVGAKISEVISRTEFVHVRVAINRNYRWGLALMGHVRGGWTEEGAGAKKWVTITTCWIRAPDADPVCHLIDKSSIFCIKSSQLYVSVAPVTVSDNSIYLSHIMPRHFLTLQIFHSDFHILIPNNFHGGIVTKKIVSK